MLQTGKEWCMHAEEGNDVQGKRLGNNKHETLFSLICKQTNPSQNSTKMNPFSPFTLAGSSAGKGRGKSIPSVPLVRLPADSVWCGDPAQCWHIVGAQQV